MQKTEMSGKTAWRPWRMGVVSVADVAMPVVGKNIIAPNPTKYLLTYFYSRVAFAYEYGN